MQALYKKFKLDDSLDYLTKKNLYFHRPSKMKTNTSTLTSYSSDLSLTVILKSEQNKYFYIINTEQLVSGSARIRT